MFFFILWFLFQNSTFVQHFIQKLPCRVPRVLDLVDCPPHNIVHDIMHYTKYYDPLYYPEIYPEIFVSPCSVMLWLKDSLCSHILSCSCSCMSELKISVQWRESYYIICSCVNGKIKQCTLSLEYLQSKKYSHCQVVTKLCKVSPGALFACDSDVDVYSVVARKGPAWLFRSEELCRGHLSQLPASVLLSVAKLCSGDLHKFYCNKPSSISKIIEHFVLERNMFLSAVRSGTNIFSQDILRDFVEHTERLLMMLISKWRMVLLLNLIFFYLNSNLSFI